MHLRQRCTHAATFCSVCTWGHTHAHAHAHAHTTNSHSQHHTFEVDELLRVTKVEPSGQACQLCIQMGWIVVAVNDVVVMSKEEMLTAIAQCAKEDNPREVSILFDVFTDETKITDEYSNTSLRTDKSLPAGIYPHLPYF